MVTSVEEYRPCVNLHTHNGVCGDDSTVTDISVTGMPVSVA